MRTWTTAGRPAAEHYSYWREVICEAFTALDPVADSRTSFESSVVQKDLGDAAISDTKSKAQSVVRGVHEIRRIPSENFFVNLQLSGNCLIRQDGRETLMRPGDFYIVDTTRPYEQGYEDFHVICVRLPRHLLVPLLKAPLQSTAVRLNSSDGGLGSITGSFIRSALNCPDGADPQAKQVMVSSLVNLLAVTLGGTIEAKERGRATVRQGLRDAVLRHVESHISDPALSAASVAARFHISVRYLHKLFEEHERSFAQTVLARRLEYCALDLADAAECRPIAEIAYRRGFSDLSHFCRIFRRRFGVSARSFRLNAGAAGRHR